MLLTREQILQAEDLKTEEVHVPEWGGTVCVRALTGDERDRYEGSMLVEKDDGTYGMRRDRLRATLAALSIVDENGAPLFTAEDVAVLGRKSASALDRVADVARRLSGLTKRDMEELEKNSAPDRSGASGSN